MSDKPRRLYVSFGMGKSSAEMCRIVKTNPRYASRYDEIIFGCANTTREHVESLIFGKKVDDHLGLNCTVVEAVIHHGERLGSSHNLTTWDNAIMDGSVFEEMIKKYGIPNKSWPHCTRELKTNPMESYLDSIGWTIGTFDRAIGYRYDELDRVPENYKERRIIFPLIDAGIRKIDIYRVFDREWPFTLNLEEEEGNCVQCHKKNEDKQRRLVVKYPSYYDWTDLMETTYGRVGPEFLNDPTAKPRVFFRHNRSTKDLRHEVEANIKPLEPEQYQMTFGECQESCEPFME